MLVLSACDRTTFATRPESSRGADYVYGTVIGFGTADGFKVSGWSRPEQQSTWSEGNKAVLALNLPPSENGRVDLVATMSAYTHPPALTSQPVEVYANEQKIADWVVSDLAEFSVGLPDTVARKGGTVLLSLQLPKAASPKSFGDGEDSRILGICMRNFRLVRR
ncbi:MAG: hypothetical protein ABR589_00165 [Chthoniobacterales bacterium]